jgi:hypothetical protein
MLTCSCNVCVNLHVQTAGIYGRAVNPDSFESGSGYGSNPDPGFDDQKLEKIQLKILYIFFDQKRQFTYVLATGEAFSPQKRTSSTSKNQILLTFFYVWGHFCPPGSGSGSRLQIRIRVRIQGPH